MKKIFWCSVAVAVAAASSVYLASRHVEECSFKSFGHAIAALGGEENAANDALEPPAVPAPASVSGLPTVPVEEPVADVATLAQVVAVADGAVQGQIIFDESDPGSYFASDAPMIVSKVGETIQAFPVSPSKMPYCDDNTVASQCRMPYAEDQECGEEESEVGALLRQAAWEATEEAGKSPEKLPVMPQEVKEQEKVEEEQQSGANTMDQNAHYHDHDQVCPFSGHSCPLPRISPPAPEIPMQKKETMDPSEEQELPHQKLDTMEFRPSDAGFQRFTPKPF